ncbi:MAG: PD40 domain-containing protein [Alphaproteobacteria bacterium]|nr:PD40 domain-containing protein [Alphaproteobacteria bacterium]
MKLIRILSLAALCSLTDFAPSAAHEDVGPAWSPDGEYVYFYSYRGDVAQLYRMLPDGSEQTRLTDGQFHSWWATPISKGELIVVSDKTREQRFSGSDLYLYEISGETYKQLTFSPEGSNRWAVSPVLSQDKNQLAYLVKTEGYQSRETKLMVLDLASGHTKHVLQKQKSIQVFTMSADGQTILYATQRNGHPALVAATAGTGEEHVVLLQQEKGKGAFYDLTYTADGERVAFSYSRGDFAEAEIYSMNSDGSGVVQLTHNKAADLYPRWSPDAGRIVFASLRDGDFTEIYSMNADGSNQRNLTNTGQPAE